MFCREAIQLIKDKTPSTIHLRVPTSDWINLCLDIFVEECELHGIRHEEDPVVDVIFETATGDNGEEFLEELADLSDEEIQDLIDDFIDTLEDINDLKDDDDNSEGAD